MKLYTNLNTLLVFYFTAGIIISLEPFHFSMQSVHLVFSRVHHFLLGLSFLTLHFLNSHCCPNRKLHPQAQELMFITYPLCCFSSPGVIVRDALKGSLQQHPTFGIVRAEHQK